MHKKLKTHFKHYYAEEYDEDQHWDGDQLDLFDQILEIEYVDEIPEQDYNVLRKYIPSV